MKLNQGPFDLQLNALPLSYAPNHTQYCSQRLNHKQKQRLHMNSVLCVHWWGKTFVVYRANEYLDFNQEDTWIPTSDFIIHSQMFCNWAMHLAIYKTKESTLTYPEIQIPIGVVLKTVQCNYYDTHNSPSLCIHAQRNCLLNILFSVWDFRCVFPNQETLNCKKGAPGLEPGTSWSAGKCSTAELYPLTHIWTMTSYKYQRISYATSVPQNMYYVCTEHCNVLVVCAAAQRTPYCNVDTLLPLQLAPAVVA